MSLRELYNKINKNMDIRTKYFIEKKLKKLIKIGQHCIEFEINYIYDIIKTELNHDKYIIADKNEDNIFYLVNASSILKIYIDIAIENNFRYHLYTNVDRYYFVLLFENF